MRCTLKNCIFMTLSKFEDYIKKIRYHRVHKIINKNCNISVTTIKN